MWLWFGGSLGHRLIVEISLGHSWSGGQYTGFEELLDPPGNLAQAGTEEPQDASVSLVMTVSSMLLPVSDMNDARSGSLLQTWRLPLCLGL